MAILKRYAEEKTHGRKYYIVGPAYPGAGICIWQVSQEAFDLLKRWGTEVGQRVQTWQIRELLDRKLIWTGGGGPGPPTDVVDKKGEIDLNIAGRIHRPRDIDIQIRFDEFGEVEVRYWFRREKETEINLRPNVLKIETLKPLDENWFQPVIVPDDLCSFWYLHDGVDRIELRSKEEDKNLSFVLKTSKIFVFRRDPERDDGWLSQQNLCLYEPHIVVFREWLAKKVRSFLEQVCEEKLESPKPICVDGKEKGWQYITDVEPKVLTSSPDLNVLSVTTPDRISFIDGLSVKDNDHRAYLDICLPTVLVPDLGLTDKPLYIDGKPESVSADHKIDLDRLSPGDYRLSYGNKSRTLRVVSPKRSREHEKQTLVLRLSNGGR